jgi:hypothetical protein
VVTVQIVGWVIAVVVVGGMAVAGGIYTASRTGSPIIGAAFGIGFAAVFAFVMWRALRGGDD